VVMTMICDLPLHILPLSPLMGFSSPTSAQPALATPALAEVNLIQLSGLSLPPRWHAIWLL
jgi:hypothetical protein